MMLSARRIRFDIELNEEEQIHTLDVSVRIKNEFFSEAAIAFRECL